MHHFIPVAPAGVCDGAIRITRVMGTIVVVVLVVVEAAAEHRSRRWR